VFMSARLAVISFGLIQMTEGSYWKNLRLTSGTSITSID
jgi:hypothetical protein